VLVNGDVSAAHECGADGVHLKAAQLRVLQSRPGVPLVAASCHDAEELALAHALEADFVVLGPVAPTLTHPGANVLGWARFAELVSGYALPVFALGGMRPSDLSTAWQCGAHGIAMQRAAWSA
jgi:8-oxo-dGTP diphosphatase